MSVFTVKLNQDESIEVMADIVRDEDGILSFYNEEKSINQSGGSAIPTSVIIDVKNILVCRFSDFEYFYISTGPRS